MSAKPIVLVAEDDDTLRFLAKKQLSIVGMDCRTASDGAEAVAMAAEGYDMILMDLSMPQLNGIEATSRIREQELKTGSKRTPIIGLTAFSERQKCIAAGMDDFIQKPLLLDQLRVIAKKFLNHSA